MKTLFHNMCNKIKGKKPIDLWDGMDRRFKHLPMDVYGFEQDYNSLFINGVLRFPVTSGNLIIVDPNSICDYFNEESREKDIIHSHGVVISQHGCSGWLYNFNNIYRLFNFGSEENNGIIQFDGNIIVPTTIDTVYTWEQWESPFSNSIDTDVCCLAIIDYVDVVKEIVKVNPGKQPILNVSNHCEIGYEYISNYRSGNAISDLDEFEKPISLYIKSAQQADAPEPASPAR